jgi:uncharacterized protein with GYD domain
MPRYLSLLRFTAQGTAQVAKSTRRAHAFAKAAAKAGVVVESQYWTLGHHDGVLILQSDSEEKVLRLLAELAAQGNVRTETSPAYSDAEFDRIVKR